MGSVLDKVTDIAVLGALAIGGYFAYNFLKPKSSDGSGGTECGLFQYYCQTNNRCLAWGDLSCPDGNTVDPLKQPRNDPVPAVTGTEVKHDCGWFRSWCPSDSSCHGLWYGCPDTPVTPSPIPVKPLPSPVIQDTTVPPKRPEGWDDTSTDVDILEDPGYNYYRIGDLSDPCNGYVRECDDPPRKGLWCVDGDTVDLTCFCHPDIPRCDDYVLPPQKKNLEMPSNSSLIAASGIGLLINHTLTNRDYYNYTYGNHTVPDKPYHYGWRDWSGIGAAGVGLLGMASGAVAVAVYKYRNRQRVGELRTFVTEGDYQFYGSYGSIV